MSLRTFLHRTAKSNRGLQALLFLVAVLSFSSCKEQEYVNPYIYTEEQREAQKKVDEQVIRQYFRANNVDTTQVVRTASGLYYLKEKEGTGPEIKAGTTVDVHYIGRFTNNAKFESSYDRAAMYTITVDVPDYRIPTGWHEGMKLMREGETARLFIPSYLGYGHSPRNGMPPNAVLIYEISVMKVR